MNRAEGRGYTPEMEQNPLEIAQKRFGVNLNEPGVVLDRMYQLLRNKDQDGLIELSNLFQDHQKEKKPLSPAEIEAMKDQSEFNEGVFRIKAERELRPVLEERIVALNDQLEAKGMKLIPQNAVDKAIDQLVEGMVVNVKFQSSKTFDEFDVSDWVKSSQEIGWIDQALQKAA